MPETQTDDLAVFITGLGALGEAVGPPLKDGVQMQDALTIAQRVVARPQVVADLKAAFGVARNLPSDVKAITAEQALALIPVIMAQVKRVQAALAET
jgi:hypothetical protein